MTAKRGAKPNPSLVPVAAPLDDELLSERRQQLTEMRSVEQAYSEERDLVNQLLGQVQAAESIRKISRTIGVSKIAFVKENKLYRALAGKRTPNGSEFSGTWEEFCELIGMSADKADEDIKNLRSFGEDALESMSQMGIGYRDMRAFRRLPDDSREALIEAAKSGDKDQLLDLAEELIARQSKEREALQAAAAELKADLQSKDDVAATKTERIQQLEEDLAKARRQAKAATPDATLALLRTRLTEALQAVESTIAADGDVSSLRRWTSEIVELADANGVDVMPWLAGVFAQVERTLWSIRDEFMIPPVAVGNPAVEARMSLGEEG